MNAFHFTGQFDTNNTTFATTVEMGEYDQAASNAFHAALEAGRIIRAEAAAKGITGRLVLKRHEGPVVVASDEFAAVRAEGRSNGLTEAQIERFIARMAA